MNLINIWRQKVKALKVNIYIIYLAARDPRVPWYAKGLALIVVAYAFSPIDLIPDFIPILGYLDDLILLPLGIIAVLKLIPKEILNEYQERAESLMKRGKPKNWVAGILIITLWFTFVLLIINYFFRLL